MGHMFRKNLLEESDVEYHIVFKRKSCIHTKQYYNLHNTHYIIYNISIR